MLGFARDRAVRHAREDVVGDRRVRVAEAVVGLGQPVALHVAQGDLEHPLEELAADLERDPRRAAELVRRLAEQVLGEDVGAAAGGEVGVLGDEARLDRDVHRRVAHPEHHDGLVAEEVRVVALVVVRVHLHALEGLGAGEGGLGPARVPVVAVGDEQRVVAVRLAVLQRDLPDAVGAARGALDAGLEADAVADAEVVDVVVEVLRDVGVVGEVGIGLRHREVRVLHALARGVDVQRAVGGGHPVGVAPHPVAADAVGLLVGGDVVAALGQGLDGGDAGGAGADDARGREERSWAGPYPKVTLVSPSLTRSTAAPSATHLPANLKVETSEDRAAEGAEEPACVEPEAHEAA